MGQRKNSLCEFSCTAISCTHYLSFLQLLSPHTPLTHTSHTSHSSHTLHSSITSHSSHTPQIHLTHTLLAHTPHVHSHTHRTLLTCNLLAHTHTHTSHTHLTLTPHTHTSHRDGKEVAVVYFRSGYSPDQYSSPDGTVRHCCTLRAIFLSQWVQLPFPLPTCRSGRYDSY